MVQSAAYARRSPLRRAIETAGAEWADVGDSAVAVALPGDEDFGRLGIADLSPLPRIGFKGRGTLAAMQARGISLDAIPNRAFRQLDGGLCLVLSAGEVMLLGGLDGASAMGGPQHRFSEIFEGWRIDDGEGTYPLLRRDSHAWFAIMGDAAPQMFAKICGVDLRSETFPNHAIAQTSAAKLSAIIVRADVGPRLTFHVLMCNTMALYFLECLLDAGREFGGRSVGLNVVRTNGT